MVAASAGRGVDCDVKENYGWARALLGSYANCRVLMGNSPDVGSRDIAGPTCIVVREVFKPKKGREHGACRQKKELKNRVGQEG